MEALVYDFKIGELKIQEKVGGIRKNRKDTFMFTICKNNGKVNKKQNQMQYQVGDNDFYWFNCPDKKCFFVIPEKELIVKDFIGSTSNKKCFSVNPSFVYSSAYHWLKPYLFDYEDVDKNGLCHLLRIPLPCY
jgi:hypothetical protein